MRRRSNFIDVEKEQEPIALGFKKNMAGCFERCPKARVVEVIHQKEMRGRTSGPKKPRSTAIYLYCAIY